MLPNDSGAGEVVVACRVVGIGSEQVEAAGHRYFHHDTQDPAREGCRRLLPVLPQEMPCLKIVARLESRSLDNHAPIRYGGGTSTFRQLHARLRKSIPAKSFGFGAAFWPLI